MEIERILQETTAPETRRVADKTPEPQMKAFIAHLVQEFHQDALSVPTSRLSEGDPRARRH